MILSKGIKVRTRRGTTIGVIPKLMNMHAALSRSVAARDVVGDGRGGGFGGLLEGDGAADLGVAAEDCDCCGVSESGGMLGWRTADWKEGQDGMREVAVMWERL